MYKYLINSTYIYREIDETCPPMIAGAVICHRWPARSAAENQCLHADT